MSPAIRVYFSGATHVLYRWQFNCGYRSGDHLYFRLALAEQMGAELEQDVDAPCSCAETPDFFELGTVYCPRCGLKANAEKLRVVARAGDDVHAPKVRGFGGVL